MKPHWTAHSTKDFVFRIALDFIAQLDKKMESEIPQLSRSALAKKLRVSKGRVSQLFNNPENIELETIVKYSKALNMKVALVAYEDDDPKNVKGPIDSEIFKICWEKADKPRDFWALEEKREKNQIDEAYTVITNAIPANEDVLFSPKQVPPSVVYGQSLAQEA